MKKEMTASMKRKGGRPRNADRQVIPWPEIDRLLVFGEMVRDEATGREDLRYPSQRELGRRYGVSGALIGRYAKEHQCMKRREENQNRAQARFEQKVVEKLAEARAISTAEAIEIVDAYMRAFREALEEGRVRVDNASDFNTMTRLKQFLEGKADSRQEVQGVITLEQMQARHRALRAQLESLDPAVTGEVPPRERDRARRQLAEPVDHDDNPHDTDQAPRRASEGTRVRRLPAEHTHRAKADRPAQAPRRRAGGDGEPAPRRRVAAHDREDARRDDELAQEHEDARRGQVRTLRRRTCNDMDLGHDIDRGEVRIPRRTSAANPTRPTAQRLGHPGREARAEGPDVVYPRSPGRGWETEPQHDRSVRRPGRGW